MRIYLGKPRYRDSGALYDAYLGARDGEMIVKGSTEPFFDACRVLLARGVAGQLEMVGPDNDQVRLSSEIEWGAGKTVRENDRGGPDIRKWVPFLTHTVRPNLAKSEGAGRVQAE